MISRPVECVYVKPLVAVTAVHPKVVVLLLYFAVCCLLCFVIAPGFVMYCLVCFIFSKHLAEE